jgi:hypothetical protein
MESAVDKSRRMDRVLNYAESLQFVAAHRRWFGCDSA